MGFRLYHKYPGLPLWAGEGVAQTASTAPPPWPVLSGRFCLTEVAFRLPEIVWERGDRVRFRQFGRGWLMEGAG